MVSILRDHAKGECSPYVTISELADAEYEVRRLVTDLDVHRPALALLSHLVRILNAAYSVSEKPDKSQQAIPTIYSYKSGASAYPFGPVPSSLNSAIWSEYTIKFLQRSAMANDKTTSKGLQPPKLAESCSLQVYRRQSRSKSVWPANQTVRPPNN